MDAKAWTVLVQPKCVVPEAAVRAWRQATVADLRWVVVDDPPSVFNPDLDYQTATLDGLSGYPLPPAYRRQVYICTDPATGEASCLRIGPNPDEETTALRSLDQFNSVLLPASSQAECDAAVLNIIKAMLAIDVT